jgi:DNA-binding CsgD family transcriptional regulator
MSVGQLEWRILNNASTDAVVEQIYCASRGAESWRAVLDLISVSCGAAAVVLMGIDRPTGIAAFSHVGGAATRHDDPAHLLHSALWVVPALATDRHGWWHCHHHVSQEQVATSALHQDYLIPMGGRYISAVPIATNDEAGVLLSIVRGIGQEPLNAACLLWLDRLIPHLVQALEIHRQLGEPQMQAAAGQAILNRMVRPLLLVDALMVVRYANAAGQDAIRGGLVFRKEGGRLHASDPSDDMALRAAIADLCTAGTDSVKRGRRFVRLRGTRARDRLGVSLWGLGPAETEGIYDSSPLALVVLNDGNLDPVCDPVALQEMFGLTLAEAQVATLLIRGQSIDAIAVLRGVAISTVRAQVNTVKAKTGSKRQIDMTRRLLALSHGFKGD